MESILDQLAFSEEAKRTMVPEPFEGEDEDIIDGEEVEEEEIEEPVIELPPLEKALAAINSHPLNKAVNYNILKYCLTPRPLAEVEDYTQSLPEFREATNGAFWLINSLVDGGALINEDLDEQGNVITTEKKAELLEEGKTEEEINALIVDSRLTTSDIAKEFVENNSAKKRLDALFEQMPARKETFIKVLKYINEKPRLYTEVQSYLDDAVILERTTSDSCGIQPSLFVDRLERNGVIHWDNAWTLTEEGKTILEDIIALEKE